MTGKKFCGRLGMAALLTLLIATNSFAGPYFGEWSWWGHQNNDNERGDYAPLHYWGPWAYQLRAQVHPSNQDEYPPGPTPTVPPSYEREVYRSRSTPPAPSSPYSDPEAYFGRPIAPPQR